MAAHADGVAEEDARVRLVECYVLLRALADGSALASAEAVAETRRNAAKLEQQIYALMLGRVKI